MEVEGGVLSRNRPMAREGRVYTIYKEEEEDVA